MALTDMDGPDGHGSLPQPVRQTNLTDPDSQLMRQSDRHEYRQAYNAQAVVETVAAIDPRLGLPTTALGDAGYANTSSISTSLIIKRLIPLDPGPHDVVTIGFG
jgi:hypothetical protein